MSLPCLLSREVAGRIRPDALDRLVNSGGRKLEVARCGQNYKERMVARLLRPESSALDEVSR